MIAALLAAAAVAATPPVVREGVWGIGCSKDEAGCSTVLVRGGEVLSRVDGKILRMPLRLVPGDPLMLRIEGDKLGEFIDLNEANSTGPRQYVGAEVRGRDARRRITAFRFWAIWCEAPPDDKTSKQPGVRWDPVRHACLVDGKDPIRAASADWRDDEFLDLEAYWLRDAGPEEEPR
ncbi:MAG: hypothetical protein QM608_02665 [Caulobacter sp.]